MIDCNFIKPHAGPEQSIFEVFDIMRAAKTDCLPVYRNERFIGVITLMAITEKLVTNSLY